MKCPYRKVTYHHPADNFHCAYDEEGFANCYGEECPCYVPERHFSGDILTTEYCLRVCKENKE